MDPVVSTRYGRVRGSVAGGVATFKGIPYAAPPFGDNRLQPPRPVEPWSGVRDALTYGPKSPQLPYPPPIDLLIPELVGPGEDCLNLNIWSPDLGPVALPAMVWIPGGMFQYHGTGASPWYDGSRFARDGVICVTINTASLPTDSSMLATESPTWACSTRWPRWSGCTRTSPPGWPLPAVETAVGRSTS